MESKGEGRHLLLYHKMLILSAQLQGITNPGGANFTHIEQHFSAKTTRA
jgi:hypothetical protein